MDNNGSNHTHTTGYFSTTAVFYDNWSLSSAGPDDIIIAKTSGAGVLPWIKRAGEPNVDNAL